MSATVQDVIMLFGDSLTQRAAGPRGFAQRLSYAYNRKLDLINRGLSGYNTAWSIPVYEQCLAKRNHRQGLPKIRLLTIWFGANDATLPGTRQHVPLPVYRENIVKLIHMVSSPSSEWYSPETKVILFTPPPVNTHQRLAELEHRTPPKPLDRAFDVTTQYAEAVREIGKQEGVPVLDVYTLLWEACGKVEKSLEKYLCDGLHLNEDGYDIVFDELDKTIEANYPELHYERLGTVFPLHDHVELENPLPGLQKKDIFNATMN